MVFYKKIITFYIHNNNCNIDHSLSEFTHLQKGLELLEIPNLFFKYHSISTISVFDFSRPQQINTTLQLTYNQYIFSS